MGEFTLNFFPAKWAFHYILLAVKVNAPGTYVSPNGGWWGFHMNGVCLRGGGSGYSQDFDREVCPLMGILIENFDVAASFENFATFIYLFVL